MMSFSSQSLLPTFILMGNPTKCLVQCLEHSRRGIVGVMSDYLLQCPQYFPFSSKSIVPLLTY